MKKSLSKPGKTLSKPKGKSLSKKEEPKPKRVKASYPAPVATYTVTQHAVQAPKKKGKSLSAPPPPPPAPPKSGPEVTIPKGWKWKGKKDTYPLFKKEGYLVVQPENMPPTFPRLSKVVPPDTAWRIDPKGKRLPSLVTVLPNGITTAWDSCNRCVNHATRCICGGGIIHPRGLEWIYITALMDKEGVDYMGKGTGKVDATQSDVRLRALHHYKGRDSGGYVPPAHVRRDTGQPAGSTVAAQGLSARPGTLSKPAAKKKALVKKAGKPVKPVEQVDVSNIDMVKLGSQAEQAADKMADDFMATLSKKPVKKTLSKKGKK